jgi:putative membrane protein
MKLLLQWLISTAAILVASALVPGSTVTLSGALIAAVVLAAANLILRPFLFLLSLPITVLTFGLFVFVINALLVWLTASIVPGFSVPSFFSALLFAVVLSIISWVFHLWKR